MLVPNLKEPEIIKWCSGAFVPLDQPSTQTHFSCIQGLDQMFNTVCFLATVEQNLTNKGQMGL